MQICVLHCFHTLLNFLNCALTEEDMMDAVQTAQPAQPSEELTELGKCLLKHEVNITSRGQQRHH